MSVSIVAAITLLAQVTFGQWGPNTQGGSSGFNRAMGMGGGMGQGFGQSVAADMGQGSRMGGMGAGIAGMGAGARRTMGGVSTARTMSAGIGGMGASMGPGMGGSMGAELGGMGPSLGLNMGGGMSDMGASMGAGIGGMGGSMGPGMGGSMGGRMGAEMGGMGAGMGGIMRQGMGANMGGSMGPGMGSSMPSRMGAETGMSPFGQMNTGFPSMNAGIPGGMGTGSSQFGSGNWGSDSGTSGWESASWNSGSDRVNSQSDRWSSANAGQDAAVSSISPPFFGAGSGLPMRSSIGAGLPMRAGLGLQSSGGGWGRGFLNPFQRIQERTVTCAFTDTGITGAVTIRRNPNGWGLGRVTATIDLTSTTAAGTFIAILTQRGRVDAGCTADGLGPLIRGPWGRNRLWGMWGQTASPQGLGSVTITAGQSRDGISLRNLPFRNIELFAGHGLALCSEVTRGSDGREVCSGTILACCKLGYDNQNGVTPQ